MYKGDSGVWNCQPKSQPNQSNPSRPQTPWSLIVLEKENKVVLVDEKRLLRNVVPSGGQTVATVQEGESLTLLCGVIINKEKEENSALQWALEQSEDNNEVDNQDLLNRDGLSQETYEYFIQNNDHLVGALSSATLSPVDRGSNLARVSCSSQSDIADLVINVEYPPTFTLKRTPGFGIPILEGMTVSLDCKADVQPKILGSWLKDEAPYSSQNGSIVIDAATVHDIGWYQCYIIYNGEEYSSISYFLSVQPGEPGHQYQSGLATTSEPPSVRKSALSSYNSSQYSSSLEEGGDNNIPPNQEESLYSESNLGLIANNVMYAQNPNCTGSYNFVAPDKHLHIFPQNLSVTYASVGQKNLLLSYEVCSNPKPDRLIWATPIYTLRPGETSRDSSMTALNVTRSKGNVTCHVVSLVINEVLGPQWLGEYILVARNHYGVEDSVIYLQQPPGVSGGSERTLRPTRQMVLCTILLLSFSHALFYKGLLL